MEKRASEASKKRPLPSPGAELLDSNKRNEENDSEIFTMDSFSTDLMLRARYVAAKQASFDEPFELSEGDSTLTHAIRARVGAPLSDDAVADILKKVKPDCHKAQAWVKAQELSKVAMEQIRANSENRDGLRKKLVRQSHGRARQAEAQFDAPRYQATAPAPNLQAPDDRTVEEELEDARVVYNRVSLAHDRLLKTIADMEEFRKTLS
ncbi:unnamed protein product [Aspergillus oryzae]|nr:unnamed protein product [Aspergillus oryzae]GMG06028.1 unnamed protein product [Aspergillus oryzae]GMG52951.1 unnamed protein product [Aspergillus oryzae var. brunneus]